MPQAWKTRSAGPSTLRAEVELLDGIERVWTSRLRRRPGLDSRAKYSVYESRHRCHVLQPLRHRAVRLLYASADSDAKRRQDDYVPKGRKRIACDSHLGLDMPHQTVRRGCRCVHSVTVHPRTFEGIFSLGLSSKGCYWPKAGIQWRLNCNEKPDILRCSKSRPFGQNGRALAGTLDISAAEIFRRKLDF